MDNVLAKLPSVPDYSADWDMADKTEDYQLSEVAGNGYGVIGYYGGKSLSVKEAFPFIVAQYERFGQEVPDMDMLSWCWDQAFYYIDQFDPYALMTGSCDVIKTEEAYYYQYAVSDDGKSWMEVEPDEVETFRYWDKGEESWNILMQHPGLEEYFDHIYDYFDDHFSYIRDDDHAEAYGEEWELMNKYGPKTQDIAHLGIWAAIMWMSSPLEEAKAWRYEFHPIFNICYEHGACVLHAWTFHDPNYFERLERRPKTCAKCGIDSWCVDYTMIASEQQSYICEHCLSDGLPFPGRVCGTRLCEKTSCPHHPVSLAPEDQKMVAKRKVMQLAADERFGALQQLPDGRQVRELPGYIKLNEIAMNQYAGQISSTVADVFGALLAPPKKED